MLTNLYKTSLSYRGFNAIRRKVGYCSSAERPFSDNWESVIIPALDMILAEIREYKHVEEFINQ